MRVPVLLTLVLSTACASFGTRVTYRFTPQQVMAELDEQGYFARCRAGEMRGCSYFARLVAQRLNPEGSPDGYGVLTKPAGGSNIEGYADDAIVLGSNPSNTQNVFDLVVGSGAPGANWGFNGPLPRRTTDVWEAPNRHPLTAAQLAYLRPGGGPPTPPVQPPTTPPPTNLQPVLDALAALSAKTDALAAQGAVHALSIEGARVEAVRAAEAAKRAQEAAEGVGQVVDRLHQDVLVAVDLGRQMLAQSYTGRSTLLGRPYTLTITPNRP